MKHKLRGCELVLWGAGKPRLPLGAVGPTGRRCKGSKFQLFCSDKGPCSPRWPPAGKPTPSGWGELTHSWGSGLRGQVWVKEAKCCLLEKHSRPLSGGLLLCPACPGSTEPAAPRARSLGIRDETLLRGAVPEKATRVGWGWGATLPRSPSLCIASGSTRRIQSPQLCAPVLAPQGSRPFTRLLELSAAVGQALPLRGPGQGPRAARTNPASPLLHTSLSQRSP